MAAVPIASQTRKKVEKKYGLPLTEIELRILLIPARNLVTIPTELFLLLDSDDKQINDNWRDNQWS
jgi:hypothetical protein